MGKRKFLFLDIIASKMDRYSKFKKDVTRLIECTICLSLPESGPIYRCSESHIICPKCHLRLNDQKCPTCGASQINLRCRVSERLLELLPKPCTNSKNGCEEEFKPAELLGHERGCRFREISCISVDCNKRIPLRFFLLHAREDHEASRLESGDVSDIELPSDTTKDSEVSKLSYFQLGHVLFYHVLNLKNGIWYSSVHFGREETLREPRLHDLNTVDFSYKYHIKIRSMCGEFEMTEVDDCIELSEATT